MPQRDRAAESHRQSAPARGVEGSAPRATPLALVSGAIAGDDLNRVTTTVAIALGRPIAVAVQIGEQVVGIVTAAGARNDSAKEIGPVELRAWLEAAAAAASINALIREAQGGTRAHDGAALLHELTAGVPDDLAGFLARCRRAGCELNAGATALAARVSGDARVGGRAGDTPAPILADVAARMVDDDGVLATVTGPGRLLALVPAGARCGAEALAARLRARGLDVAVSAPRRDPAVLNGALLEVELLLALADGDAGAGAGTAARTRSPGCRRMSQTAVSVSASG